MGWDPNWGHHHIRNKWKKRSHIEGDIHQALQPEKASRRRGSQTDFSPQTAEKSPPSLFLYLSVSLPLTPQQMTLLTTWSLLPQPWEETDTMPQWRNHCFFSRSPPAFSTQQGPPTDSLLFKEHSCFTHIITFHHHSTPRESGLFSLHRSGKRGSRSAVRTTDADDPGVPVSRERSNAPGMWRAQQRGSQGAGEAAGSCSAANPAAPEPQLWTFFPRSSPELLRATPDVRNLSSVQHWRFWRIHSYISPKGLGDCLAEHGLGQGLG